LGLARALEGFGELPRFTAQGLVERHELSHLLGERGAILSFGDVGLFDLALEFGQTQLERFEQGTQFVLVLLGEAARFLFEDVVGQILELLGELLARVFEQAQFLCCRPALGFQLLGQSRLPFGQTPVFFQCLLPAVLYLRKALLGLGEPLFEPGAMRELAAQLRYLLVQRAALSFDRFDALAQFALQAQLGLLALSELALEARPLGRERQTRPQEGQSSADGCGQHDE